MWALIKAFPFILTLLLGASVGFAQTGHPVLVLDVDRAFRDSSYGQAVNQHLLQIRQKIENETALIISDLEAEEKSLADLRTDMKAEDFATLAAQFDAKVTRIRAERSDAMRELSNLSDQALQRFLSEMNPLLDQVLAQKNASVIISQRNVIMIATDADVTSEIIELIDQNLTVNAGELFGTATTQD